MLKNTSWMVALAGLTLAVPSAWAADTDDQDDRLEERVEGRIKSNDRLHDVKVDVDSGVVTMTGEVASRAERVTAEKLARAEGARRIVNKVEVDPDKAAAAIDERAKERKDKVDERADKEKEKIDREAQVAKDRLERRASVPATTAPVVRPVDRPNDAEKVVRSAGDAWITTKLKTKFLADDLLDKADLHVDTDAKGVVTLTGTVPSEAARNRAVEVARTTEGVRTVVDKIVVGAPVVK